MILCVCWGGGGGLATAASLSLWRFGGGSPLIPLGEGGGSNNLQPVHFTVSPWSAWAEIYWLVCLSCPTPVHLGLLAAKEMPCEAYGYVVDVSDEKCVREAARETMTKHTVDILVNNAGIVSVCALPLLHPFAGLEETGDGPRLLRAPAPCACGAPVNRCGSPFVISALPTCLAVLGQG